jgi:hypothetical protein
MARYKLSGPNGKQYILTGPEGASKEDLLGVLQSKIGSIPEQPVAPTEEPDATFGESIKDVGVSALQGVLGAKEAITGIADIPTMGLAGKGVAAAEKALFGGTSQDARAKLQEFKSEEAQQEEKEIAETKGFFPTVGAYLERPGALLGTITESVPSMLGGAGIARSGIGAATKLVGKKAAPLIAGAVGEGAITAGSIAESTRQQSESGLITPGQAAGATIGGALTAGLGVFGGKVAQKLGVTDVDTLLAGGISNAEKKNILKAAFQGALSESVFEELPQSLQEQITQNINMGRPWDEGVAEAGASGALAGAFMGGTASALSQAKTNMKIAAKNETPPPTSEKPPVDTTLTGDTKTKEPAKEKEEDINVDDILSTKEFTDDQLKPKKSRGRVPVSGGPAGGVPPIAKGADGSGLVSSGANLASTDDGAGAQPTALTKDSLLSDMAVENLQFKNTSQVRNYLKTKVDKATLAQLELETPSIVKDLFDERKSQAKLTNIMGVKAMPIEGQADILPTYLETKSLFGMDAPGTRERGIQSAAIEEAFDSIDSAAKKQLKAQLGVIAAQKTKEALADREARIQKLIQEQKLSKNKAAEAIGPAKDFTFSSQRPTEFMTRDELLDLYKDKRIQNARGLETVEQGKERVKAKEARDAFINLLNEEEKAAKDKLKDDAIIRELESSREQVINDQKIKDKELQKQKELQKDITQTEDEIKEAKLIPEADTMPALETQGQILNKGTRIVNKAVNSAISNNKPFLEVLSSLAGGEFNKYFSYQTTADMLGKKISVLAKPKAMGIKGMTLPTIKYGTVEKGRPGKFDPATNTITIDPNNAQGQDLGQIITHETMHYMLDHIIDNRKNLSEGQKNALKRLEQLHKQVKSKLGKDFDIPNLKEFVAEAFSNSEFQRALASLRPAPGSKLYRTAADIVWNISKAIVSALGLRFDTVKPVVLQETIDLVSNIITDKAYTLPTETMMGKAPSFAPKQAGQPKTYNRQQRLERLRVKEYHRPTTVETINKTLVGEKARDELITKFQNSRYAIKKWQQDLMKAGKITVGGPNFTNVYDQISLAFGEADFRNKEYLMAPIQKLQNLINDYAKTVNKSVGDALAELHEYAEALHEPERRHIKFLRTVPLSLKKNLVDRNGNPTSAAAMRDQIFQAISTQNSLSDQQIKALRAKVEDLVAKYKDKTSYKDGGGKYESIDENSADYNVTAELNSQDVQEILKNYRSDPNKKLVDEVLASLKPIQEATIELNRQGNYWSNSTDNITRFYNWQNYIPLKGRPDSKMPGNVADLELEDKRLSSELKESPYAFEGRLSESQNPIIQTMVDSALSAARAGRKGLTQSIKNAVQQKIIDGEVVATYTPTQIYKGLDQQARNLISQRSSIVHHNEDGSMDIIQIKDPALLESIRRTYKESHPVLDILNRFTSLIGQSHTRYNPAFPVLNFVRDSLTNAFVMAIDIGPLEAFKYIGAISVQVANGGLFKANRVARYYARGDIEGLRRLAKKDPYVKDMVDYIEQGGLVSIVQGLSVKGQLNQLYKELNQNKILKFKEQIDPFFDGWVSTFELASRAAAYRIAKSDAEGKGIKGKAAQEVGAAYAKQLANFEEVGEWGKTLGALFVFFRPSATGAVRAFESIGPMLRSWESVKKALPDTITKDPRALAEYEANWKKQSRTASAVVLSLLGAGATVYLMAAGLADDDDEGRNKIINDDLSRWTRFARFDIGEDKVVQIPWGFGLGGFMAAGAQIAGAMSSKTNDLKDVFSNVVNIGLDSFIPLPVSRINMVDNPSAFVLDSVTPSLARPFFEYAMNMNAFGQEIYNNRQSRFGSAYTGGDNIPDMYKDAARFMVDNWGVNASPNSLYFFANNYMDGLTRIMQNGYGLGLTLAGQKDFDAKRDLFVLESFISNKSNVDQREFGKIQEEVKKKEAMLNMFKTNPEKYAEYISKHPLDPMIVKMYNQQVNSRLKNLQEQANKFRMMPGLSPKDRKEILTPNKEYQNMVKRQITSTLGTLNEINED